MKKIIKCFSIFLFSFFVLSLCFSNPIKANYDPDKNKVSVSISLEEIKISVKYQRGFDLGTAKYKWCRVNEIGSTTVCGTETAFTSGYGWELDQRSADVADNNPQTKTYTINKANDEILRDIDNNKDSKYKIVVSVTYCAVRSGTVGSFNTCSYSDSPVGQTFGVNGQAINLESLTNNSTVMGDSLDSINDDNVRSAVAKISEIVYGTVMPVIWICLGLFTVIKGSLLGVQIVKAADEPQIRQEKLGSLKWLVIGMLVAFAVSGGIQLLTGYLKNTF